MVDQNVRAADPRNYGVPEKVSLWIRNKGSTDPADWKDLGSVIDVSITPEIERLEHFANRRGARAKDREVISSRKMTIDFSIEEVNLHNLQHAFQDGEESDSATKDYKDGRMYPNPGTAGTIELGDTNVKNVVVRDGNLDGDVEAVFTEGVEYSVDLANGIVTILGGGLADEEVVPEVHIFYEKEVTVTTFQLFPGTEIEVEAQFQIVGAGVVKQIYTLPNAVLRNNGAISIGDGSTWQSIPLTLEALVDATGELGQGAIVNEGEL
jgi:hypothetical protein